MGGGIKEKHQLGSKSHTCATDLVNFSPIETLLQLCAYVPPLFCFLRPSPPFPLPSIPVKKRGELKCIANAEASVQPDLSRARHKRTSAFGSSHGDFPFPTNKRRLLREQNKSDELSDVQCCGVLSIDDVNSTFNQQFCYVARMVHPRLLSPTAHLDPVSAPLSFLPFSSSPQNHMKRTKRTSLGER